MHRVNWTRIAMAITLPLMLAAGVTEAAELPPRPTVADVVKASQPAD